RMPPARRSPGFWPSLRAALRSRSPRRTPFSLIPTGVGSLGRPIRCLVAMVLALAYAPAASAQKPEAIELDSLERRARIDSADADLQYDLGMGYVWARRYDEAEQAFRRAVAIEPRLAPAHLGLSYLPYLRSEKLWKALMKGKVPREQQPVVEEARRHRRDAYMIDPMVNSGLVIMPWWVRAELSEKEKSKMPPGF